MFGKTAISNTTMAATQAAASQESVSVTLAQLVRLRGTVRSVKRPAGRQVRAPSHGGNQSRALGRGLDFAEVREYNPGDDVRMIDWKVTARSGKTHTKIYNEERERPFLIVVDLRPTMFFATRVAFKSVVAAKLGAMVAWAAASNRDRVGGLIISSDGLREIKPANGSRGVTKLLNEIVSTHDTAAPGSAMSPRYHQNSIKQVVNDGVPSAQQTSAQQLVKAFQHLQRIAHTGSSICLLTDFAGLTENNSGALSQLLKHNHVAACRVHDPLEASLPKPARYAITDGARRSTFDTTADKVRLSYEQSFQQRCEQTRQLFSGHGNSYLQCSVADSLVPVASRIMRSLPGSM